MSEQRVKLTFILLDLLDQQSKRKRELLDTLYCLELQRENEHQDFWLLQYQKLLDSQPGEQSFRTTSIDPMLGYNFLVNGVVHCIPFLSKLWQSKTASNIIDITNDDLLEAGIKNASDREKILQSIRDFLKLDQPQTKEAIPIEPTAPQTQTTTIEDETTTTEMESECVICMEEPVSQMHGFQTILLKNSNPNKILPISVQSRLFAMWSSLCLCQLSFDHRKLSNVSSVY